MNKVAELKDFIDQHNPYIIGIPETWCIDLVNDAELSLGEYNSYFAVIERMLLVVECCYVFIYP